MNKSFLKDDRDSLRFFHTKGKGFYSNLLTRSKPIAFIARGQYWVNNHAHVLDSSVGLLLEYVAAYINAINLAPYVTGTAQPKMNQEKMNSILIPIPPTGEQLRIVQKIDEIFPVVANM